MSRKLRILHIGNGAAFKIRAIIEGLLARGHEIHMAPIPPSDRPLTGVTWHRLPDSPLPGSTKVLHRMLQMRRLARAIEPDVVHAHNAWGPGWYGAVTGVHPFVIHGYGGDLLPEQYQGRPALQRRITSWACQSADRVIVTGEHMIGAAGNLGIDPGRVELLPRGVDLKRYRPGLDTSDLRRQLGLEDAAPIVLSPRYQVDEALYNLDIVIEAMVEVKRRFPKAACVQMADLSRVRGVEVLRSLAARRGLDERSYSLTSSVDNEVMPLFYNLADVAVSTPSSDGFPVTVLEASASGCPLVVSDLPYCRSWFAPRENGLIVPVRDAAALADAICTLYADRELSRRIAAAARQLVETHADYEKCMDRLETLYFNLLGETDARLAEAH